MKRRSTILAGVVALAMAASLGACTKDDDSDLPTVGGSASSTVSSEDLVSIAQTFHDCLTDAGLPAVYQQDANGLSTIVSFDGGVRALGIDPDGFPFSNESVTTGELEDFLAQHSDNNAILEVDGVDHTEAWVQCYDTSGYSMTNILTGGILDSQLGVDMMQLMVESSNQWAACARENGFPETKDAVMTTQFDFSQIPTALLPTSMTAEQLEALLQVCPNFDAEQAAKNDELLNGVGQIDDPAQARIPEGYVMPPNVGFDYPGFDGQGFSIMGGGVSIPDNETSRRLNDLMEILTQAQQDYYASGGGIEATP
ncbi:MAG: hypothetical protein LBL92_01965 [Propionibacteriaceae bacterium]|nr:hypothetical protein [Propionibacteriaceae bacterium]